MADSVKRMGPYEIQSTLGCGAMGVVYKAYDPRLNRTVVIKTIRRESLALLDENEAMLLARFKVEAESAGSLKHTKIVTVHEFVNEQDPPYIVMEYVDGKSLRQHLDLKRQFPVKDAINIVMQLLDGLDHAHKSRVVHRDIKPANIMLTADGNIKITDFGIARLETSVETSGLTKVGAVLGTPSYMSPEQARGMPADHRSDIYSAAVVLYELLTGEKPSVSRRSPQTEPALPLLTEVVAKALEEEPDKRFQSAMEFLLALREIYKKLDLQDKPKRIINGEGARRRVFIGLVSVLVLGTAGTVAFVALRPAVSPPSSPAPPPTKGTIRFSSDPQGAVILLNDGEFIGVTPTEVSLNAGIYQVSFEKEGYHKLDLSVEVEPGRHIPIDVVLNARALVGIGGGAASR